MGQNTDSLKSKAEAFLRAVSSSKVKEGYELYVGEGFKHHNVYFKGDADSLRTGMEENYKLFPGKTLEIKRVIREEKIVAIHSLVKLQPGDPGYALMHIFRFENEKIAELWDFGQPIPSETVNENGPF
jgi:predicted SnoaL-like aldol condensation-catalyzing enzyme